MIVQIIVFIATYPVNFCA